jgi:hypothetical protein
MSPLVRVVADRLVVAFRTALGLDLVDLPLLGPRVGNHGSGDGPDTLPPGSSSPLPNEDDDGSLQGD